MNDVMVRRADASDRAAIERMFQLFRHDLSEHCGQLPNPDGSFRSERVESAFGDPSWAAYLLESGDSPAGFAFVRDLDQERRVLNSFFVVRGVRRSGLGLRAVLDILSMHPGPWEVAFQDANEIAAQFWRRVATCVAGTDWSEERRPVPGKPDLPPDVWISFETKR